MDKTKVRKVTGDAKYRGAQNRARGEWFEYLITRGCDFYRKTGIADIEKTPEPMKPVRSMGGGKFIAVYTKAAQADYKGCLAGGRAVYFEAKATNSDRMLRNRVTENQLERLHREYQFGAVVFVLCAIGDRFFRIPWETWYNMKEYFGHNHFAAKEAEDYEIKIGKSMTLLFLENLRT